MKDTVKYYVGCQFTCPPDKTIYTVDRETVKGAMITWTGGGIYDEGQLDMAENEIVNGFKTGNWVLTDSIPSDIHDIMELLNKVEERYALR